MRQPSLAKWLRVETRVFEGAGVDGRTAVSLFDSCPAGLLPWAHRGYNCLAIHPGLGERVAGVQSIEQTSMNTIDEIVQAIPTQNIRFIIAIPPATNLCAAGARWWKSKRKENPEFQTQTANFILRLKEVLTLTFPTTPLVLLLPNSAKARALVGRPSFTFDPCEFSGYIRPDQDPHPVFPETVPKRDRYTKRTACYLHNCPMPLKLPESPVFDTIKCKSGRTKRISPILKSRRSTATRSMIPRGLAEALANVLGA